MIEQEEEEEKEKGWGGGEINRWGGIVVVAAGRVLVYPQKIFSHKIVSREALYLVSNYIPPVPQKIVSLLQLLPVTIVA